VRTPDFLALVRHLRLPKRNLSVVYLHEFKALEVLDLRDNNFKELDGLENLTKLFTSNVTSNDM
jgi:Leucine-rich repeat (LRR) protein